MNPLLLAAGSGTALPTGPVAVVVLVVSLLITAGWLLSLYR
ncbi:hypothetical protein [Halobaculum sp. D14]